MSEEPVQPMLPGFASMLFERRLSRGLSRRELARRTGVSRQTIERCEAEVPEEHQRFLAYLGELDLELHDPRRIVDRVRAAYQRGFAAGLAAGLSRRQIQAVAR